MELREIKQENVKVNFTGRELDVLALLAEGKTNSEIGKALFISVHTVKAVLEKIYEKIGCHNRVQASVFALQNKILN